jgi:energy-coupling factor transporter ATP-binding protein EcfA2
VLPIIKGADPMSATETVLARGMQPDPTTPGVRINRLEVSNYKRIDHLAMEFPLPPMSKDLDIFVLGSKNGGGKSSVLECCALLLLAGAGGRMRIDRSSLGDVLPILIGLLIKAGRDAARISGELDAGGRACHIELRLDESGFAEPEVSGQCFPAVNDEKHARPADPDEALSSILAISSEPLIRPPLLHFNSYRKVLEFNPELGMLADDYGRVSSLAWRRRMAMGRVGTAVSAFKLEVLRSLMGQASLFEGLDQQESEGILETLNNLIERYCGGRIDKLRALADNRVDIRIAPRNARESFSFDGLSSGQKEMIATLFLIWRNTRDQPSVVLIDEPELHLNAEWHADFVEQLRRLAPRNQYILATHSEDIFRSVDESRRAILLPDDEDAAS